MHALDAIVVGAVILFLIVSLYWGIVKPVLAFLIAIVVLVLSGLITPKEAVHGFANEQLAVIILLLVISGIIHRIGVLDMVFRSWFSRRNSPKTFLAKMVAVVGGSSAFLNNTPLVAMFIPYVYSWSKEKGYPASKLLIPLSYASILGGCITLIGTSTNLIVNGLAIDAGQQPLGIFDFLPVGGAMLVLGSIYLYFFSGQLLPNNDHSEEELVNRPREYFVETQVRSGSRLVGKDLEQAGLRDLDGLFLVEIARNGKLISPVSRSEVLEEGDDLFFVGDPLKVSDLKDPALGLSLPKSCDMPIGGASDIVEVVVAQNSYLVGKQVRNTDFRAKFDGAILAIHRNGEQLKGHIGEIELKAGDALLVLAGNDLETRMGNAPDFYRISTVREVVEVPTWKKFLLVAGFIVSIGLAAAGIVPLFTMLLTVMVLFLVLGLTTGQEVRRSLDWELIMVIALGLALGKAIENSGVSILIANMVLPMGVFVGAAGILAVIFAVTNLLSAFMTSKAAVAIVLPISLSVATALQAPVVPFILIVAFGGAANFITPIGYQTNLMVYGPGRYSFSDFMKIGLPLTLLYLITSTLILAFAYELF